MSVTAINPVIGASALTVDAAAQSVALAPSIDLVTESRRLQSILSGGALRPVRLNAEWTRESIRGTIIDAFLALMEELGLDAPARDTITDDLIWKDHLTNSLDRAELMMKLDEAFGSIPDEEAVTLTTLGKAIDYVAERFSAE